MVEQEPREWLIRKGGYFYRPNCAGYTTKKYEAGRYTKAEAECEAAIEPWHMKAIHESEWPDDPVSAQLSEITALRRRMEELEAREIEHGFRLEAEEAKSEHWRAEAARLREALELGIALVSAESGWGTYRRMDAPEMYVEADAFAEAARAALGRKA